MLNIQFDQKKGRPLTILCLGAHSDDIEIGCGGTILKLTEDHKHAVIYWVVFSSDKKRKKEAEMSAQAFLAKAERKNIIIKGFRDGFFPYLGGDIKKQFEELKRLITPDVIFTHHRSDLHQDHRLISDLTWNTFRNHMILEYEVPKYDGDMGSPNFFVPLDRDACKKKIEIIMRSFKSQEEKHWFSADLFLSLMRVRGMECNSRHNFAEGFYCRKVSLSF